MLDIVFENKELMIINKPRGLVVHPGNACKSGTLQNKLEDMEYMRAYRRDMACRGGKRPLSHMPPLERCGIIHRLDKNTAGLLIVAKTPETQVRLKDMLEAREIHREYIGLVEGVLLGKGTIDKNITRMKRDRTLYTTCGADEGRTAVTHYEVIENYKLYTLVRFKLETGRTHQIRVHCKSIGRPIVGDPEYNPNGKLARGQGQMLEAVSLKFDDISVQIEPTEYFKNICKKV